MIRIKLAEIVRDIRKGLGDVPIMEKYNIRPAEYMDILYRLKKVRAVGEDHLKGRISREEVADSDSDSDGDSRTLPRCYLVSNVRVVDLLDRTAQGELIDLTEQGCKVRGIECRVGDTKRLHIEAEGYMGDTIDLGFAARCRWANCEQAEGSPVAGFEITKIETKDKENLRAVIRLLSICDE